MVARQPLAVLILLCGVCAAADARTSRQDGTKTATPAAEQLVRQGALLELTNATLARRLAAAATPEKCIIFTTTSAFLPPLLNMTRNWFAHVHKCATAAAPHALHCASAAALRAVLLRWLDPPWKDRARRGPPVCLLQL